MIPAQIQHQFHHLGLLGVVIESQSGFKDYNKQQRLHQANLEHPDQEQSGETRPDGTDLLQ